MVEAESKRFPFINLEKALARAKQLFDADQRGNEMSNAGAFAVWGYSDKSSGGFQTIGALRAYGLLEGTDTAKIKLSRDAFNYFRDEREDVRAQALQSFALAPPALKSLYKQWDGQPPADTLARSYLKIEKGFNEQSARAFLNIYKENLAFANLKGGDKVIEVDDDKGGRGHTPLSPKVGDYVQWTSQGADQFVTPRKVKRVTDDSFVIVHGSMSGIPMAETTVVDAPASPKPPSFGDQSSASAYRSGPQNGQNDINVLLSGKRLQITADVDAAGLETLTEMIEKYKEILVLLNRQ